MRSSVLDERRFEPVLVYSATPGRGAVRWIILVSVGLAPLAIGSGHPPAYIPLLVAAYGAGLYSLLRERQQRRDGVAVPPLPGGRALLAMIGVVALQLVPLPPLVLRLLSPGSFAFYNDPLLLPLREWKPITASPADTLRGLAFLAGMSLLYRASFRELDQPQWRRRLMWTVVAAGFLMTIEALVQHAYSSNLIYGLWHPQWDWAVFGPYIDKNLFAGYMLMAVFPGAGFCAEAADRLRHAWGRRRRRPWLALGDPEGSAFIRRAAVAMVLVTGLLATGSRGGLLGFVAGGVAFLAVSRRRRIVVGALVLLASTGLLWVGLSQQVEGFVHRGSKVRLDIWGDSLRLIPLHPLFGAGFNAFGTAYPPRQRVWTMNWIGTTHNDYLQVVVDLGLVGAVAAAILIATLLTRGRASAGQGAVPAGLFAGLVAVMGHNLVDANWQLAANAATFVTLAGLAVQSPGTHLDPPRRHA
jgi:O-antigen ligase